MKSLKKQKFNEVKQFPYKMFTKPQAFPQGQSHSSMNLFRAQT